MPDSNESNVTNQSQGLIVILTDTYTYYQRLFIDPLSDRLQRLGYGVLIVCGHEISPKVGKIQPTYEAANRIYSIVNKYNASGIIILTGCLGHNLSLAEIQRFVQQYTDFPTISLGANIPGCISVTADNDKGMLRLMQHLIANSNQKNSRYLFLRGFKKDIDSLTRERVFRASLEKNGIPINEDRFLTGNYVPFDAYNALDQYLTQNKDVDIVVSANDDMAIAAIRALKKHGLSVPDDVLVTGFDDTPSSRACSPPLTTVNQSIETQAEAAINILTQLINSPPKQKQHLAPTTFDCELIIRKSSEPAGSQIADACINRENDLFQQIEDIISEQWLKNYSHQPTSPTYTEQQVKEAVAAALTTPDNRLKKMLNNIEANPALPGQDLSFWRQVECQLSAILQKKPIAADVQASLPEFVRLINVLGEFNWAAQEHKNFDERHSNLLQSRLRVMISKCTTIRDIAEILSAYFEQCGIRRGFLVTYEKYGKSVDCQSQLRLAFNNQGHFFEELPLFRSDELLPEKYTHELKNGLLILSPLFYGNVQYGYILVDTKDEHLSLEYLTYTVSQALENIHNINALRVANSSLQESLDLNKKTTDQLADTNTALQKEIIQRKSSEIRSMRLRDELMHMGRVTTMGGMATGLAHEINQPLLVVSQSADTALLVANDNPDSDPLLLECLHDIQSETQRAGDIIRSLRQFVSRGTSIRCAVDINELVWQTVHLMKGDARISNIDLSVVEGDIPESFVDRVQIAQVLVNLLSNSIDAIRSVEKKQKHSVIIETSKTANEIVVTVIDTGSGFAAGIVPFKAFETSKENGLGVGLSISQSIIESYGGRFLLDRNIANGCKMTFTLPLESSQ